MFDEIVSGQILEINREMSTTQIGAKHAQKGGQRQGDVVVLPEDTYKLEGGDATTVMGSVTYRRQRQSVRDSASADKRDAQDGMISERIESRTG